METNITPTGKSKLFEALSKAQAAIEAAHKTQKNEAFKKDGKASKYADITDVIDAIREPAGKNGLSVFFNYKTVSEGTAAKSYIQYIITHSSGEAFESEWLQMFLRDNNMHGFGAGNTYYRRQLLKGIYQIPEEDDDGNSQSLKNNQNNNYPQNQQSNPQPKTQPKSAPQKPAEDLFDTMPDYDKPSLSPLETLYMEVDARGIPPDEVKEIIKKVTGSFKKSTELKPDELKNVLNFITKFKS